MQGFLALMLVLAAAGPGATAASPFGPKTALADWACPFVLPAPEVEGDTYVCGSLTVQLAPGKRGGATIDLAYAVLRATGPDPEPDPVLWLEGGPGASALVAADTTRLIVADVRRERDVILLDQRGAGYSGYLECGAQQAAAVREAVNDGVALPSPPPIDAGIDAVHTYAREVAALGLDACRADYDAAGLDLRQFRTETIAADGWALFDALGHHRATLWGTSYGGRVAQEMAAQQPDRVRALVLDSPLPREVRRLDTFAPLETGPFAALVAACAADPVCAAAYPDLEARALDLVAALNAAPLDVAPDRAAAAGLPGGVVDGAAVVALLTAVLPSRPDVAAWLPRAIADLERGDPTVAVALLAGELAPAPAGDIPRSLADADFAALRDPTDARLALSLAMRSVVLCNDEAAGVTLADIAAEAARATPAALTTNVPLRSAVTLYAQCEALGLTGEDPLPATDDVVGVPTLVLAGAFDATTAPAWGALAANEIGGHIVVFPQAGHATTRFSSCARAVAAAFVAEPDSAPNTGCLADEAVAFALPDDPLTPSLATIAALARQ